MTVGSQPLVSQTTSAPRFVPWTVETFHRACSLKIWGEGKRMILIRGELMEQRFTNPLHATTLDLVGDQLRNLLPSGWRVRVQVPLVLSLDTDPIPDFAVVSGFARDFLQSHPTTAALVVEISDSTLFFDTTTKAELYATANIADYWVLDLENRRLLVFRDPVAVPAGGIAYRTRLTLGPTDRVSPRAMPQVAITVNDLLP